MEDRNAYGGVRVIVVSWGSIMGAVTTLHRLIDGAYDYEVIVAIESGGWVPAKILGSMHKEIRFVNARLVTDTAVSLSGTVDNKRVLIIDDIVDSGKTMGAVKRWVKQRTPASIMTASLYTTTKAGAPDFYVNEVNDWVKFPWEHKEEKQVKTHGT